MSHVGASFAYAEQRSRRRLTHGKTTFLRPESTNHPQLRRLRVDEVRRPSHGRRTTCYKGCQRWEDPVGTDAWFGGSAYTYMHWERSRVLTQDNLSRHMLRSFSSSTRGCGRNSGLRFHVPPALSAEPPLGNTVWLRRQSSSRALLAPPRIISEGWWTSRNNKTRLNRDSRHRMCLDQPAKSAVANCRTAAASFAIPIS
jgi:hypothetical protein